MKFMLMMHAAHGRGDWDVFHWTPEARAAHQAYWEELNGELRSAGELVRVDGLSAPAQTRVVRSGESTQPIISDGPFPESKEFLAGYWIIDVASPERAYAIAARASAAPGPNGEPLSMPIEIREVMFSVTCGPVFVSRNARRPPVGKSASPNLLGRPTEKKLGRDVEKAGSAPTPS